MKKQKMLAVFVIALLVCSTAFAQAPVAVAPAMSQGGFERIGIVAAAQGKVEVTTSGSVGRIAESGQPIHLGDAVETDAEGHLQILLLDETVFTIGPNSSITIDRFIYDPKTHKGNMEASIAKGVFRYVSGKIAAKKPSNVLIKLPNATIGIRGTIVGGEVTGGGGGGLVMLFGPGENNNSGARIGSFRLNGTNGPGEGQHRNVIRAGFGVNIGGDGGLSGVFLVPQGDVNRLTDGLLPGARDGKQPSSILKLRDTATQQSGQGVMDGGEGAKQLRSVGTFITRLNQESTDAAQDYAGTVGNVVTEDDSRKSEFANQILQENALTKDLSQIKSSQTESTQQELSKTETGENEK